MGLSTLCLGGVAVRSLGIRRGASPALDRLRPSDIRTEWCGAGPSLSRRVQYSTAGRFYAQAVNMVRLESGQTVSVDAELQNEYGES
jgi:hypothetical protein